MTRRPDPPLKFWSKVNLAEPDQCWNWKRSTWGFRREYGKTMLNGKIMSAHVAAYLIAVGPVPDGFEVCHKCDNGLCCNPQHLWLGTHQQNMQDRENKFRRPRDRGEANVRAKLTWDDVTLIREQLAVGIPRKYVAETFHVTTTTIRGIELNLHWKEEWRPK